MIPPELIHQVNEIRTIFQSTLESLGQIKSFEVLLSGSEAQRERWEEIRETLNGPRFRRPCDGRIVCAIVGASTHGKTTALDELFPELNERGWLITEATDTTSQSLRIEYAPPGSPSAETVTINTWDIPQINKLVKSADEDNEQFNVQILYEPDAVIVDGTQAKYSSEDRKYLKFDLRQELRPFPRSYEVTAEQSRDEKFIRSLTIKELSENIDPQTVLSIEGHSYNSLQLRAVVKDVTLGDSFDRIIALSRNRDDEPPPIGNLVFIDTPGLGTKGSIKDEVLILILGRKSPHIVLQLLEDDELDIVLHLVLCGGQSTFGEIWKAVERERGLSEAEDLVSERLFIVINGANKYFRDPVISRKWDPSISDKEGDPFAVALRENILERMTLSGYTRPAGIFFIDSILHVSRGDPEKYEAFYKENEHHLRQAIRPGGVGYETLKDLRLDQTFAENVEALCNPEDRGQGFLIRQIESYVAEKGPAIFLQRFLLRTELLARLRQLRELVSRYYEDDGSLRTESLQATLEQCLSFLAAPEDTSAADEEGAVGEFAGINIFATTHMDKQIDELPVGRVATNSNEKQDQRARRYSRPGRRRSQSELYDETEWVGHAYRQMCKILEQAILAQSCASEHVTREFTSYFRDRTKDWGKQWGYMTAKLSNPLERTQKTDLLIRHCLKFHCREIIWVCPGFPMVFSDFSHSFN